ncbi:MAG: P-loop NTPase [Frankiaceae bacterium]|nr:P-loop NTPase [Frankiaceae bacterium]
MTTLSVVTAIADPRWEADLVAGFARADGVTVVRRCVDVADLLAATSAGIANGVVASADLRRLDRDVVTRLDLMGVAVVGMHKPDDAEAEQALRRLGVTHLVSAKAPPEEVIDRLRSALELLGPDRQQTSSGPAERAGPPVGGLATENTAAEVGRLIAVWGPTGAPGRTTVAIGLAAELAIAGQEVVLVDADVYGGTVAPMLGVVEDGAGFASACRLANAGRLDAVALASLARKVAPRLRVLTGIARADRWDEVRPSAAAAVLALAQALGTYVVVDCGFCLEEDEELSYDTAAPRRNGATVTALRAADTVVAVGGADPIGLQRLVRGLTELGDTVPGVDPVVVVNRVRARTVASGDPRAQIEGALQEFASVTPRAFVPLDQAAMDKAVLQARTMAEAAPASPARRALADLAATISGEQPWARVRQRQLVEAAARIRRRHG